MFIEYFLKLIRVAVEILPGFYKKFGYLFDCFIIHAGYRGRYTNSVAYLP